MRGLAAILVLSFVPAANALEVSGAAVLTDGDTLKIGAQVIRLIDVDAFESGQDCERNGRRYNCGSAAERALRNITSGREVSCTGSGRGDYGRLLATCYVEGRDIGRDLVLSGHAFSFRGAPRYLAEEAEAKEARRGAWSGSFTMPWIFRDNGWANASQKAPDGRCPIKGNISNRGRIYHMPWSRSYRKTKINTDKGERWFCDEAEALAAGWRAPFR